MQLGSFTNLTKKTAHGPRRLNKLHVPNPEGVTGDSSQSSCWKTKKAVDPQRDWHCCLVRNHGGRGRGGTFIRLALPAENAASNQSVTPKQRRKKAPQDKEKLRPDLREILKRVLQGDTKDTREEDKITKAAKAPIKATTRVS